MERKALRLGAFRQGLIASERDILDTGTLSCPLPHLPRSGVEEKLEVVQIWEDRQVSCCTGTINQVPAGGIV